jgi:hypothetical protein
MAEISLAGHFLVGLIGPRSAGDHTVSRSPVATPEHAVKVTEFVPGQRMVWSGGMPLGLFKGVRTYTLAPQANGTTKFNMREEYKGPMLPVIWRSIPDLGPSFTQFANGLKQRVEADR